ncbi:MAG: hypothetical protein LIO70_09170 [Clostridiales bacterium]|nr:hypothetical protein [Clostridiales bacterium]
MMNKVEQEQELNIASQLDDVEYEMECAACLAFCVGTALEVGEVNDRASANALYGLHNHLMELSVKLDRLADEARAKEV